MTLIMSLVGMVTLVAIALVFSYDRKAIRLRTVLGAFAIQAGIGAFVLYVPFGQAVLQAISAGVSQVLVYANDGIGFLFGGLADVDNVGFVFAIKVLPVTCCQPLSVAGSGTLPSLVMPYQILLSACACSWLTQAVVVLLPPSAAHSTALSCTGL